MKPNELGLRYAINPRPVPASVAPVDGEELPLLAASYFRSETEKMIAHVEWRPIVVAMIALLTLSGAAHAQRARAACDTAAARDGYRIVRRDTAKIIGTTYELPLHVVHGTHEADVICRYDTKRGIAELPRWDERTGQPARWDRADTAHRTTRMSREAFIARQECENSINSRPGFRVQRLGAPVARGAGQWDVPLTVRQDDGTDQRATCRYNAARGTVSLRRR